MVRSANLQPLAQARTMYGQLLFGTKKQLPK